MQTVTTLQKARAAIQKAFNKGGPRLVAIKELRELLGRAREQWGLATSTGYAEFLRFLVDECGLREVVLRSPHYGSKAVRYLWGDVSPYVVALSLRKRGYLSHGSAVFLHGITDQIPKSIYVNVEQSPKPRPKLGLSQERIDRAFSRRQRLSNLSYQYDAHEIVLLSGKNTASLGVTELKVENGARVQATGLERTLIDIVVRPGYAGGLVHVLEAFKGARARLSVPQLLRTLEKLEYAYPYHQSIGFLMKRSEYPDKSLDLVRALPRRFDFYLGYGLGETSFDEEWRLHYPKGL